MLRFAGSVLVISHDRWFLDRVVSHILAFEGDGSVALFPGSYTEYEGDRRRRLGADADQPHRVKLKKLRAELDIGELERLLMRNSTYRWMV